MCVGDLRYLSEKRSERPARNVTGSRPSDAARSATIARYGCPLRDETEGTLWTDARIFEYPDGTETVVSSLPCVAEKPPTPPGMCAHCAYPPA